MLSFIKYKLGEAGQLLRDDFRWMLAFPSRNYERYARRYRKPYARRDHSTLLDDFLAILRSREMAPKRDFIRRYALALSINGLVLFLLSVYTASDRPGDDSYLHILGIAVIVMLAAYTSPDSLANVAIICSVFAILVGLTVDFFAILMCIPFASVSISELYVKWSG